jgi:hypothetical protein
MNEEENASALRWSDGRGNCEAVSNNKAVKSDAHHRREHAKDRDQFIDTHIDVWRAQSAGLVQGTTIRPPPCRAIHQALSPTISRGLR